MRLHQAFPSVSIAVLETVVRACPHSRLTRRDPPPMPMLEFDGPDRAMSADTNSLARQAVMLEVFAEPLMVQRVHIALAGNLAAGVMLSHCGYVSDELAADQDGWFTKTAHQWEEELGLTRREQEAAKKSLRDLGVLTYRKVGSPARIWYQLNRERLGELVCEYAERKWVPILEQAREAGPEDEGETFVPYEERPALAGLWREWLRVRFDEEGALSANGRHDLIHGVEAGVSARHATHLRAFRGGNRTGHAGRSSDRRAQRRRGGAGPELACAHGTRQHAPSLRMGARGQGRHQPARTDPGPAARLLQSRHPDQSGAAGAGQAATAPAAGGRGRLGPRSPMARRRVPSKKPDRYRPDKPALDALVRLLEGRIIAYHPRFVEITGRVTAAVMLAQLFYWSRTYLRAHPQREGWMWKSQEEWERETGLSRREQENAREALRQLGIITERQSYEGTLRRLEFRLNLDRFGSLLAAHLQVSFTHWDWNDERTIAALTGRPFLYYRDFAHLTGSVNVGVLLSRLVLWGRTHDCLPSGPLAWMPVSLQDIERNSGLSRSRQEGARNLLRALNLIEEDWKGIPAVRLTRIDCVELLAQMQAFRSRRPCAALLQKTRQGRRRRSKTA